MTETNPSRQLRECITHQMFIEKDALDDILASFKPQQLKKGALFCEAGKTCRQMAYINSGYLRIFSYADGKEITLWAASKGKFITSLSSFIFETDSFWTIEAVTDCSLMVIDRKSHFQLSERQPKWLEFDNKLLAQSFALLEQSMFSQLHTTAKQRFDALMETEPELFNHVPLQHIASMLGITPESLSRLRKNSTARNS